MGVLINATTAEAASDWFGLTPGVERGIIAVGLAGSETVKLQVKMSDGSIADTGDECTHSIKSMRVTAANQSDTYRVLKSATVASVLVDLV